MVLLLPLFPYRSCRWYRWCRWYMADNKISTIIEGFPPVTTASGRSDLVSLIINTLKKEKGDTDAGTPDDKIWHTK